MKRRSLLAGVSGVIPLSGCFSSNTDGEETVLGRVVIMSHILVRSSIDLRIDWEGETIHNTSYEVEPEGHENDLIYDGPVPEKTWPDDPGQFTISARISGNEDWKTLTPSDRGYPNCLGVDIRIHEGPIVGFHTTTNENFCDEDNIPD